MEELYCKLNDVSDSYFDFIVSILAYAKKKKERLENILKYLDENPNANTTDIIYFVSKQPDFQEDNIASKKVG